MNKKIIEALTESRERALVQQQENQENLIHSIFPPVVADLLIENKSQMGFGKFDTMSTCSSGLMGNKPYLLQQAHTHLCYRRRSTSKSLGRLNLRVRRPS